MNRQNYAMLEKLTKLENDDCLKITQLESLTENLRKKETELQLAQSKIRQVIFTFYDINICT